MCEIGQEGQGMKGGGGGADRTGRAGDEGGV